MRCRCFFAASLLFSGCSDKENNPVSGPVVEETKDGTISVDEDWSDITKIYRVNSDCSIEANVTWGIIVGMESPLNTAFEYCSIQNATTGILVNPGVKITVKNCVIRGCASNGIVFVNSSPLDSSSFQDNSFVENGGYGISIRADKIVNLGGSCNVDNNVKGGIYVSAAEVWKSGIWKKYNAPYIVDGIVDIGYPDGVEISIAAGAEFNFLPGSFIRIGNIDPGKLIASGSEDLPILFTSQNQDEFWGSDSGETKGAGIMIEQYADTETELNHCKIQNATNGAYVNAHAKIQNCSFSNCKYYGLIRDAGSDDELISDNSFADNGTDSEIVINSTDAENVE